MGGMGRIKRERNERQGDETENHHQNRLYLSLCTQKKLDLSLKMLCGYTQNCASYVGGEHICRTFMKKVVGKRKMEPEDLRWQV